jgi:hypothetical protein
MSARWLIGGCSAHTWHRRFPHCLVGSNLCCGLRSGPALVERLYPEMGLSSKAWRFARGVSLLASVVVCLGAFLCFVPTGLDICTALRTAHSHPLDRGADEGYLAVLQEEEEAWGADKVAVNADLLTMVLLGLCFGLSFGWQLTNTQRQEALCSLGEVGRSWASACEGLSFLGVFRL